MTHNSFEQATELIGGVEGGGNGGRGLDGGWCRQRPCKPVGMSRVRVKGSQELRRRMKQGAGGTNRNTLRYALCPVSIQADYS